MADLSIQVREVDGIAVMRPEGFINAHTVRMFEDALEKLVAAGVRMSSFADKEPTLEDVFMMVTKGAVA